MILHERVMDLVQKALNVLECEDNDCEACTFIKICDDLCNLARNLEVYIKGIEEKKDGHSRNSGVIKKEN